MAKAVDILIMSGKSCEYDVMNVQVMAIDDRFVEQGNCGYELEEEIGISYKQYIRKGNGTAQDERKIRCFIS